MRHEFFIPVKGQELTILDVWKLLLISFDHIEKRDPTTRVMRLKIFLNDRKRQLMLMHWSPGQQLIEVCATGLGLGVAGDWVRTRRQ